MQTLHRRFEIDAKIDQAAKLINSGLDQFVHYRRTVIRRSDQSRIVDVVFESAREDVLQILFRKLGQVDGWSL